MLRVDVQTPVPEQGRLMAAGLPPLQLGDLTIPVPIIQGGMGVMVSTAPLAAAVANCGGAGTIASVGLGLGTDENEIAFVDASRHGLQREIRAARALTAGTIGINILCAVSNYDDLVQAAAQEDINFIISGAGLPLKLPALTAANPKIKLIPIVSSGRALSLIVKTWRSRYDRWPDAVVVEGPLAGGHLGFRFDTPGEYQANSLEALTREVLQAAAAATAGTNATIPVIAAGGIYTGADIARYLQLGAAGVQIATRFVTTDECAIDQKFKDLYLKAKADDVIIIESPVGMPGRALRTAFTEKLARGEREPIRCRYRCLKTCDPKVAPYCIARALLNAVQGDLDNAVVFAGQNVSRVDRIMPVRELMDELVREAVAARSSAS